MDPVRDLAPLNSYFYARNAPHTFVDPDGRQLTPNLLWFGQPVTFLFAYWLGCGKTAYDLATGLEKLPLGEYRLHCILGCFMQQQCGWGTPELAGLGIEIYQTLANVFIYAANRANRVRGRPPIPYYEVAGKDIVNTVRGAELARYCTGDCVSLCNGDTRSCRAEPLPWCF